MLTIFIIGYKLNRRVIKIHRFFLFTIFYGGIRVQKWRKYHRLPETKSRFRTNRFRDDRLFCIIPRKSASGMQQSLPSQFTKILNRYHGSDRLKYTFLGDVQKFNLGVFAYPPKITFSEIICFPLTGKNLLR